MTNLIALPGGTQLVGDFRIDRMLGAGGFGITYLADEIALGRRVTIKEYFPADFAARAGGVDAVPRSQDCNSDYRWGLDRFIEEAQTLARFNHPNIVRVYRYFRANNTGYMVLHFEEGQSFKSWLKSLGRAPRQKELDGIVAPLLDALELIHRSDFLHRDIAPDNIIIRKDGQPVLIDFGSARGEIAAHSKTVSALVKPGYSPYEQYAETSRQQGPWTDIYALGATLYHAVTGKRPADSPSRMVSDELVPARESAVGAYRPRFLDAIDHALSLTTDQRPQSVAAWRTDLLAVEPERSGWLSRTLPKRRAKEELAAAAKLVNPSQEAASQKVTEVLAPQPDAPGAQGSKADFFEALRKGRQKGGKPAQAASPAAASAAPAATADAGPAAPPAAIVSSTPAGGEAPLVGEAQPSKVPRIFRGGVPMAIPQPKDKEKRKPRPPRQMRSGRRRWSPVLFKLLVGVGVASAAVAVQDKLPQFESRSTTLPSAAVKPTITTASLPTPPEIVPQRQIRAHVGAVTATLYSDDGRELVSAGQDGTLKVWNPASGALVRTIELDDGPATAIAMSGSKVITGHQSGEIVLWDIDRAQKLSTFKRNDAEVWSVAFAGRPDRFAASGHDWKVALWDAANTSGPVQVIDAHESAAQAVAFASSPAGPLLASGGADKMVKLWNLDTLDKVRTYRGHRDFVTGVAFSADGAVLASAGLDGGIRLWSSKSNRLLRRLYGHRGRVAGLAFSPTGETLASVGSDGQLRLWDVQRGRTARTIIGHTGGIRAVAFSPDGERIVSGGEDGMIRIWPNPLHRPATN